MVVITVMIAIRKWQVADVELVEFGLGWMPGRQSVMAEGCSVIDDGASWLQDAAAWVGLQQCRLPLDALTSNVHPY
jgi:hypothetical protein